MNVRGRKEHMDAGARGMLQGFPGALDVRTASAGQTSDDGAADDLGDGFDRFEIAVGSDAETCLDGVDAEPVQLVGQPEFFLLVHAATGRLFTISKGRIEYRNSRFV